LQLLIDENLSPRLARWACDYGYPAEAAVHVGLAGAPDSSVFAQAFSRDQVVTANVGDFMLLAASMEVHPGVIALRQAELTAEQQWLRLQDALAYAEQTCGGDLLNCVLEVQAEGLFVLQMIPS
jgi:predicted nuclease of predicted toxin-antitoxin system